MTKRILPGLILPLLALIVPAQAEEWPKWLGPQGTGVSTETGLATKWPRNGLRHVWEQKVGLGYSSPIGFENRVYLFSQDGPHDVLTAFDAASGGKAWSREYEVTIQAAAPQAKNMKTGLPLPLATPTIDEQRIYTYGGGGDLYCRELADGKDVWHLNVLTLLHEQILTWNQASSPLVTDKFVYVQGGKGGPVAVAVDKKTGTVAWTAQKGLGGYAAPIIADVQGTEQLIIFGGDTVYGVNPDDGKTIWTYPWQTDYDVNAATPVYHDGKLLISSDYGHGCVMLSVSLTGVSKDWENKELMLKYQPAVFDKGYLYANSMGVLKCVRWPDGKVMWKGRYGDLQEGGTIVRNGDRLITMSQDGNLSLIQATPTEHRVIGQAHVFDFDTTWATPLIYHGKLYAHGRDNLVCLDIGGGQASAR